MWTVCWTDNEFDGWDRLEHKEDMIRKVQELYNKGIIDILIFSPDADEYTLDINFLVEAGLIS
jgi:tRNA A37 methylthiotransferase MiaB